MLLVVGAPKHCEYLLLHLFIGQNVADDHALQKKGEATKTTRGRNFKAVMPQVNNSNSSSNRNSSICLKMNKD